MTGRRLGLVDGLIARRLRRRRRGPARGVLVLCSGGIGDALLFSLIVARYARLAREGEGCDVVLRADTASVGFLYPPEVRVIAIDYPRFLRSLPYRWRIGAMLWERNYRLCISADHLRHPLIDDALVRFSGAGERIAMEPRSWPKYDRQLALGRRWYSRLHPVSPAMAHRMVRWVDLIAAVDGEAADIPKVRLPAPPPERSETVVIHPFSAIAERQFGVAVFQRILKALPGDVPVVLSAGPRDLAVNPAYRVLLDDPRVRLNEEGFEAKARLLGAARLVVSVDTSLMHLAVAVGAPTLCLASAAHLVDSIPYDPRMTPDNVAFLYHHMPCAGCLGRCVLPREDGRYPCVARLDDGVVVERVLAMLADDDSSSPKGMALPTQATRNSTGTPRTAVREKNHS